LGIEAGNRLLGVVQDGMLILLPQPQDFARSMTGLHRKVCAGIDTTAYLNEERATWTTSDEEWPVMCSSASIRAFLIYHLEANE